MKLRYLLIASAMAAAPLAAHAGDPGFDTDSCALGTNIEPGGGATLIVDKTPSNGGFTTLKAAVAAAVEGDHIVVHPGIYNESVVVKTAGLRISGTDRNTTILDGREYTGATVSNYLGVGIQVFADRVVIENMTARYYKQHGFRWGDRGAGVTGYWARYLTSYNNGLYGVFAFDSRCGQIDHSYTWGNADSGFYVGNCYPCDMVITKVVAENNALGYSGTNAGGNLTLRDSTWRNNAMGIVPNSLDGEDRPPQRGMIVEHNIVDFNNNKTTPGTGIAGAYWGAGIVLAGGQANQVFGNTVTNHDLGGIVIAPLPDRNVWIPSGNIIWGNTVQHRPEQTDSYDLAQGTVAGPNNCWSNNKIGNSAPDMIQTIWACTSSPVGQVLTPPGGDPRVEVLLVEGQVEINGRAARPWQTYDEPTLDKAQMPDTLPVVPWLPALGVDN